MTKSVTIINTSNHEGEDVKVIVHLGDHQTKGNWKRHEILKPGDKFVVTEEEYRNLSIVDHNPEGKDTKPFYDKDGNQVFPLVNCKMAP